MKILTVYIVVIAVTICIGSCSESTQTDQTAQASTRSHNAPIVEVENPKRQTIQAVTEITGTLEPWQHAKIYPAEGGIIRSVTVDIGDHVRAGQIIGTLANPELQQQVNLAKAEVLLVESGLLRARAELNKAQAGVDLATSKFERLNTLFEKSPDLIRVDELDIAKGEMEIARAQLASAKVEPQIIQAQIESAKAAQQAYQERVNMLTIRAPFSGGVSHRYVHPGMVVQSAINNNDAAAIIELVRSDKLRLAIEYPESDLKRISVGTPVTISFPEVPGVLIESNIDRMSAALNPDSKTITAEIDIDNRNKKLRPGMYAKVLTTQESNEALTVNTQAISAIKNQTFVFKVEDGRVQQIPVELGLEDRFRIEVFSDALDENDLVVVQGKGLISDGMVVETKMRDE